MSLSTREVRVLGEKVVTELLGKKDLNIGDAFRSVRYCVQVVREELDGELAELKGEVMRVVGHVLKRTNFKYLPEFVIDPLVEEGIESILDWIIDENAASPGEILKVDPSDLFARAKKVVEEVVEEAPESDPEEDDDDPFENLDDPRDNPEGTQESQAAELGDGPKTLEGGEDDPAGAPPA